MVGQVRLNKSVLHATVARKIRESGFKGATTMQGRVQQNILRDGLVDTGRLLHSIKVKDVSRSQLMARFLVYSDDDKAKYPEFGTRGSVAAPGHVLAFRIGGVLIFRKRTGPIRPYRFFRDARDSMSKRDFR